MTETLQRRGAVFTVSPDVDDDVAFIESYFAFQVEKIMRAVDDRPVDVTNLDWRAHPVVLYEDGGDPVEVDGELLPSVSERPPLPGERPRFIRIFVSEPS